MCKVPSYLWIFLLLKGQKVETITQDLYWRDYVHGDIPYDAFEVTPGKYVGQVLYDGHIKVATIYSYDDVAAIEWTGRIDMKENIKILCAPDTSRLYWEHVDFTKDDDGQMKNVVRGGYQKYLKAALFIGKAFESGQCKIGKVVSVSDKTWKGLWIWDKDNKPLRLYQFDILKYNLTFSGTSTSETCAK